MPESFEAIYSRKYGVPPEHFAKSLFVKCCHWWARPLLKLILRINPITFFLDLQHLESLKGATRRNELRQEFRAIESYNRHDLPAWRRILQIRVSIQKLSQFSKLLD